jgi:methyl-accepting chemotaxis protein
VDSFLFIAYAFLTRMKNEMKFGFMAAISFAPFYFVALAEPSASNEIMAAVSLLIVLYFFVAFYRQAMKGWQEMLPVLEQLSRGDLTTEYGVNLDKVGQFNEMKFIASEINENIGKVVSNARNGAEQIKTAAKEIAAGNINLSQRTEEQASTLQETSSGMEQLLSKVKQNANNCATARARTDRANDVAAKGGEMVHKLVDTMSLINKSSSKMADIIGAIETIAFQTNILALNAAVEAERAGQQGRGFAVVASEVRHLAQRSAAAAKEIKVLIEESVGNVNQGTQLVGETGQIINEVVVSVKEVTQRIGDIAVASEEQSSSVGEINRAIMQLERVTQQNAALVEETTAASVALEEEAVRLAESVRRFKLIERLNTVVPMQSKAPVSSTAETRLRPIASVPLKR